MKRIFRLIYVLPMMLLFGCTEDLSELADGSFTGNSASSDKLSTNTFVDLGLSVKWANSLLKYSYSYDHFSFGASYTDLKESGVSGGNISGTRFDNATIYGGENFRTPTTEEFNELISKCTFIIDSEYQWGVTNYGMRVKGPNGATIFIPVEDKLNSQYCLYFWTSSFSINKTGEAYMDSYRFIFNDIKQTISTEFKRHPQTGSQSNYTYSFEDGKWMSIWPVQK